MILWQDANESPTSTCVSTNFSPDFNETDISPWIFIRYSEQLWQLDEAEQAFKKEVSNYKREFLICTQGIKDTVHDYINFNGIFYILVFVLPPDSGRYRIQKNSPIFWGFSLSQAF